MIMKCGFNRLEQAVLNYVCAMAHEYGTALAVQIAHAVVTRRQNTGQGFYTYLTVDRTCCFPITGAPYRNLRDGPAAKVDGLSYGMGFILWLKEGYADHLEGYSFQEDTLGIDFENVEFELWSPDK